MTWNQTDLEEFFGCRPTRGIQDDTLQVFDYASKRLRYMIMVHEKDHHVAVSADPERPFGADSFYEIQVPCDTIQLFPDPYHPEFKAVGFWFGETTKRENLRLTIMKRPDGDLKVWSEFPFPGGGGPDASPTVPPRGPRTTSGSPLAT
jgi:hypothetical protein